MVIAVVAFLAMEPITYAVHRWVMHGPGWGWHASHHRRRSGRFERNDAYPVVFAAVVGVGFAVGFNVDGWGGLVPAGVGVTAYGAVYALVHDGFIHRRVPVFRRIRPRSLVRLEDAHRLHHRFNGEPYGMLAPVVPAALRRRAAQPEGGAASGSDPSQVPVEA